MRAAAPLPVRASVRDVLTDLLGHAARVSEAPRQVLDAGQPALCAVYRRDDGSPVAACIADRHFVAGAAAALGGLPLDQALPAEPGAVISDDVREVFQEVVNVLAKLLNSPTSPHVSLGELSDLPGEVPRDVAGLVTEPHQRCDYAVSLDGFGDGLVTLLTG